MSHEAMLWTGFMILVVVLLALDLLVFNRKAHEITLKEASIWSVIWIALGLSFAFFVYYDYNRQGLDGGQKALDYITAYLIEKSLSMDNLFVFLVIFSYFSVPARLQHRVLFWGIIGALFFRGIFIFAGVELIQRFEWVIYIFGAILIYSGLRMLKSKNEEIHPERNPVLKLLRKFLPITHEYHEEHFFTRHGGKLAATPLLAALVIVETSDIIFAVDSIPAVLAISQDRFIVFTSNVFAIFGLRALYFALAGFMRIFTYLHLGLATILVFVGTKMVIHHWVPIPTLWSLAIVASILILATGASLLWPKPEELPKPPEVGHAPKDE